MNAVAFWVAKARVANWYAIFRPAYTPSGSALRSLRQQYMAAARRAKTNL